MKPSHKIIAVLPTLVEEKDYSPRVAVTIESPRYKLEIQEPPSLCSPVQLVLPAITPTHKTHMNSRFKTRSSVFERSKNLSLSRKDKKTLSAWVPPEPPRHMNPKPILIFSKENIHEHYYRLIKPNKIWNYKPLDLRRKLKL